jgi:hypothetical protein
MKPMTKNLIHRAITNRAARAALTVALLAYAVAFVYFLFRGEIDITLPGGIRVMMKDLKSPLVQFAFLYGALYWSCKAESAEKAGRFLAFSWAFAVFILVFTLAGTALGGRIPLEKLGPILTYQPQFISTAFWAGAVYALALAFPVFVKPGILDINKRAGLHSLAFVFIPVFIIYLSNGYSIFGGDVTWNTLLPQYLLGGGQLPFPPSLIQQHGTFGVMPVSGGYLPIHPVGAAVFAFPAALLQWAIGAPLNDVAAGWGQKVTSAWVASASAAFLFQWVYLTSRSRWITWTMTLFFAFGSPQAILSSVTLWQHGPNTLLINLGLLLIIKGQVEKNSRLLWLSALPLGFLPMVRPQAVIFYFMGMALVAGMDRKAIARFILWSLPGACAALAINLGLYHSILGGYGYLVDDGGFGSPFLVNFAGLLFSANRGLFVFSPLLLLAVPGFYLAVVRRSVAGIAMGAGVVIYLSIHASWSAWYAGAVTGPRFAVETVPPLIYLCVVFLSAYGAALARYAAVGLAALSVAITAPGMYYPHENMQWNTFPDIDAEDNQGRLWSFDEWLPFHFMNRVRFERGMEVPFSSLVYDKRYGWLKSADGRGYRVRLDLTDGRIGDGLRTAQTLLKKGDYSFTIKGEAVNAVDGKIILTLHELGKRVTKKEIALPVSGKFTACETVPMPDGGWLQIELDGAGSSGEAILDTTRFARER